MVRAILFDMGGTLDGDGLHWLDRFVALYAAAGLDRPRAVLRDAFDAAERRAAIDDLISTAGLDAMIDRHVGWQLAHLGVDDSTLRRFLVDGFVQPVRRASEANARLLAGLRSRDLLLGVLSNGCGNVDVLCRDLGYTPYLASVVDSRRVGLSKPDPAIFVHAAATLGVPPHEVLMVGDSFDRDVRPARAVGMRVAWLEGDAPPPCPDPLLPDLRLRRLADLPAALDRSALMVA